MAKPYQDVAGQVFGRLTVVERVAFADGKHHPPTWLCRCVCGREHRASTAHLTSGMVRSCGCLHHGKHRTHGGTGDRRAGLGRRNAPLYDTWLGMKRRCDDPQRKGWENYGGRGIRVCERWRDDFAAFLADMGPKPSLRHSIDRIDVNGDYEPGNCRWATAKEQAQNTRRHLATPLPIRPSVAA